jgi:hypothetical protein
MTPNKIKTYIGWLLHDKTHLNHTKNTKETSKKILYERYKRNEV